MEPTLDAMAFFDLGCQVTRHIHGIDRKNVLEVMLRVVNDLASGHLTLVDSPEEVIGALGPNEKVLANVVPEVLRTMRAEERAAATVIWARFLEISEGGKS